MINYRKGIQFKNSFCSKECYNAWRNKNKNIVIKRERVKQVIKCSYCNSDFSAYPSEVNRRKEMFCSRECFINMRNKKNG